MRNIDRIYVDGKFVAPHGVEEFKLFNPAKGEVIGKVRLGDEQDARRAVAAAKRAFPALSRTSKAERIEMLRGLHDAVAKRTADLLAAMIEEYGAPRERASWMVRYAGDAFLNAAKTIESYEFTRRIGSAEVVMEPVGVVALITPWNSNYGFICSKLGTAIAAGCTAAIKPSEMSAIQTDLLTECLDAAGLPDGVFNIVNGRGEVVGAELASHPDVSKVSFTGSTAVGKSILRAAADTMKRVTLELGGKSPTIVLDDADIDTAVCLVIDAGFQNNGQACINGTRVLVPKDMLDAFLPRLKRAVESMKVGDPNDSDTVLGPIVSQTQYERVEGYIRAGTDEGATLITGGEGLPEGFTSGYFVRPTVFAGVTNNMRIAREEIFGPVIAVISYRTEQEAIEISNDSTYGLSAYVISSNRARAEAVARQLQTGRVSINGAPHDPMAPFGGYKQSGIGREFGVFGLEEYLEPKAILGATGF
jgi:aldehyde dehydrogenase (NAD+)